MCVKDGGYLNGISNGPGSWLLARATQSLLQALLAVMQRLRFPTWIGSVTFRCTLTNAQNAPYLGSSLAPALLGFALLLLMLGRGLGGELQSSSIPHLAQERGSQGKNEITIALPYYPLKCPAWLGSCRSAFPSQGCKASPDRYLMSNRERPLQPKLATPL